MKISSTFLRFTVPATMAVLLTSCAAVYTSSSRPFVVTGIQPEERTNGYIFKIKTAGKIGKVEAWIGPDNWLYMSIPDTNIDAGSLDNLVKCPIVSGMQFFHYRASVQVTLHLNAKFDHVSVLRYKGDENVYVVLYKYDE